VENDLRLHGLNAEHSGWRNSSSSSSRIEAWGSAFIIKSLIYHRLLPTISSNLIFSITSSSLCQLNHLQNTQRGKQKPVSDNPYLANYEWPFDRKYVVIYFPFRPVALFNCLGIY